MRWLASTVASVAAHGAFIGAILAVRSWRPPQERDIEIPMAFELVEESHVATRPEAAEERPPEPETEKPPEPETEKPPEPEKPPEAKIERPPEPEKPPAAEEPEPEPPKPEPPKPEPEPEPEPVAPEAVEAAKPEPPRPEPVKDAPKPKPPNPPPPEPPPPKPPKPAPPKPKAAETESAPESREESARVESAPVALGRIAPSYPRMARRRGHEGTVVVEVEVGADGKVERATVLSRSGHDELDESALKAVRGASFAPAKAGGAGVRGRLRLSFEFRLR